MACDPIKQSKQLLGKLKKSGTSRAPGAPTIVTGGSLGSRPFSVAKVVASLAGVAEMPAFERDQVQKFQKAMGQVYNCVYGGNSVLLPIARHMLPEQIRYGREFGELFEAMDAGAGHDPDQARAYRKAMGTGDPAAGGALVGPPQFGEFIPVLRPDGVFSNIPGVRNVPLPPNGMVSFPRQTDTATAVPAVELPGADYATSQMKTDQVELHSHPIIATTDVSNQLLRYTDGAAENLIREDLGAALGTTFDRQGLEGNGSGNTILGLINIPGIGQVTSAGAGANGDTFKPGDYFKVIAQGFARNAKLDTWIMRPEFFLGLCSLRAGPVTGGDPTGQFLFNYDRSLADPNTEKFNGKATVQTTIASNTRTKGSGANLMYLLAVQASQIMVGMHGAVEIKTNEFGPGFKQNYSSIRALMYGDVNVRQQAGVVLLDNLLPILT